jgi:hypothetical protein
MSILAVGLGLIATGCASPAVETPPLAESGSRLEPASGAHFGVNLDWATDSPAGFSERLGHRAAVYVRFFAFPFGESELAVLDETVTGVAGEGGMLMVTLEPWNGLSSVTPEAAAMLADRVAASDAQGVPVFVRFAHEMNGSWYPWGQQPSAYAAAFRLVADAVHATGSRSAMVWAPNYAGGYPFRAGPFEALAGSAEFGELDTNRDGRLDMTDDPYAPYYPGDDAVDWVGMSLYHWGGAYPWAENEIPEAGKFEAQLSGNYSGLNGDDTAVPDFYEVYGKQHSKPVAIPETAAFYDPARGGPDELVLKRAWWRQVFGAGFLDTHPRIKMINWFEWHKPESEAAGAWIDWRVLGSPAIAEAFRLDLPGERLLFAP